MSEIKASYDLSGGETRSSIITGGTYLDIQPILTDVSGRVYFYIESRLDNTHDWCPMYRGYETARPIIVQIDTIDDVQKKLSVQLNGSDSEYSVRITPETGTTGTLVLNALTDGSIA